MKQEPRICRNCEYEEDLNELKKWCRYWKTTIGPSRATVGCSKFVSMKEDDEDYWENITGL